MKKIAAMLIGLALAGCTDVPGAERALRQAGYKNVTITGYSMFSCGKDDGWSTGFTATAPNGERVTGAVCAGLMKGNTIRTF